MKKNRDELREFLQKFYKMTPYLHIGEGEWNYIKQNWDRGDVKEELADLCMTYPLPLSPLTEEDALLSFNQLKGTWWNDLLTEGEWFPRRADGGKYSLEFRGNMMYFRRNNIGNTASNYFQQENRWGVDGTVSPGPKRTWETRAFMVTLMGGLYTLKFDEVSQKTLRMCLSLRKYICSQFKPNVAKALYDYLGGTHILDISAGWGDRLAGFFTANDTEYYLGLDPRVENHPIYQQQADFYSKHLTFFEKEKEANFSPSPAEDFDFTPYRNTFDIVFSSPPYFSVERYSYDETQSWVRYKTIDDWNVNFLHKTIENVWPTIKVGGYLCINIADVYASSGGSRGYQKITDPMNDFISTLPGAKYEGCLGMEMAVRPGSVGAGGMIEGDAQRFTEDTLKKAEEDSGKRFAEPIWIWKKIN
jgi:hypothetical protein